MRIKQRTLITKFDNVGEFGTVHIRKRTISDSHVMTSICAAAERKYKKIPVDLFTAAQILSCLVTEEGNWIEIEDIEGNLVTDELARAEILITSYSSLEINELYEKVLEINPLMTTKTVAEKKSKS